ncbi:MAG: hypothetical protein PHW04_12220 [Candidatus Wallbacteria bacterium]|nr:hypothetical protein [Candidatus Wallbacteria bacterium]
MSKENVMEMLFLVTLIVGVGVLFADEGVPQDLQAQLTLQGQSLSDEDAVYFPHVEMRNLDPVSIFRYANGEKVKLDGTDGILQYTRIWVIGDPANITSVYFLIHGDGNTDYSDSTSSDRKAMEKHLNGEGAVIAYPISSSDHWPGFDGGKNGDLLLKMFRQIENATGKKNLKFEQFSLSGGGRVNHALLRLINEKYDSDQDVKNFVDNSVKGIHDGDSLCYSIDSMRENYIKAVKKFTQVRFCFIHNTSGYMQYVHSHHNKIAQTVGDKSYPYGGSLELDNGRLRFWAADIHWHAWCTQFEKVFFGGPNSPNPNPSPNPSPNPAPNPYPDPTPNPEPNPSPTPSPEPTPSPSPSPHPGPFVPSVNPNIHH